MFPYRLIAPGIGLVFIAALFFAFIQPRDAVVEDPAKALYLHPKEVRWQQDGQFGLGMLGTFDRAQLQRGYQVYKEVCSACHGMTRVAYRNLTEIGFSVAEVKALAKANEVPSLDPATGEPATRPALPSDTLLSPYPNEIAARAANNNALPPDLSLITKAREGGPAYIHSLLTGYLPEGKAPPKNWTVPEGLYYNPYFHSLNIAMPPPLSDGQVTYANGPNASIDQMSKDVTAFMQWAAEPKLEERRSTGLGVVIFLLILTSLGYLSYRKVWAELKAKRPGAVVTPAE